VAAFAWNGWQASSGISGNLGLEYAGGAAIAIILGQIEDKKAKEVSYRKWYVTTADCEAGVGKLVILKVDGTYDMETDYVSNGNSISSDIGDVICGIYFDNKKAQEEKGL
jgi:hypothetical protein